MRDKTNPIVILLADDDEEDRMLACEALVESRRSEIKADPNLRGIPVVVLTTSQSEGDILRSYDSGASSFISKPVSFEGLVALMKGLGRYWFEIVELPPLEASAK